MIEKKMFIRSDRPQAKYQRVSRTSFEETRPEEQVPLNHLDTVHDDGGSDHDIEDLPPQTPKTPTPPSRSLVRYICPCTLNFHHGRTRWRRIAVRLSFVLMLALSALIIITPVFNPSYTRRPAHYGKGNIHGETVFIAANIIDEKMIRGPWGDAVSELVDLIGPTNTFLSIYENDSGDGTKAALQELRQRVKCKSQIVSGHIDKSKFPTVQILPDDKRVKRIAYLAEVRNRAIDAIATTDTSNITDSIPRKNFDKLLFLNDVVFSPKDAADLLFATNADAVTGKTSYNAACAMDFINPIKFYDRFAMRDNEMYESGLPFFPWFVRGGERSESWHDVMAQKDAVRVKSCWGGMVAFEAKWFRKDTTPNSLDPLRFRSESGTFWDASECCLIHADLDHLVQQSQGQDKSAEIYVNPYVRVAYDAKTFTWLEFTRRFERLNVLPHMIIGRLVGQPWGSARRLDVAGQPVKHKEWTYMANYDMRNKGPFSYRDIRHFGTWNWKEEIAQPGGYCGFPFLLALKNKRVAGERYWEKIFAPSGRVPGRVEG